MSLSQTREDWILREARKRLSAERSGFLDGACAGDESLRRRLEARLAGGDSPETPTCPDTETAQPSLKADLTGAPDEAVGQTLGRYKVLQKIGEGGCGAVYMAEQEQPVRRRVALKVREKPRRTRAGKVAAAGRVKGKGGRGSPNFGRPGARSCESATL